MSYNSRNVYELTNGDEQDAFVASYRKCIIFFGSVNCGHCQNIKPYFETLVQNYPAITFAHVEVSKHKVEGLSGVPTFCGFANGQAVETIIGARREELANLCKKLSR